MDKGSYRFDRSNMAYLSDPMVPSPWVGTLVDLHKMDGRQLIEAHGHESTTFEAFYRRACYQPETVTHVAVLRAVAYHGLRWQRVCELLRVPFEDV